MGARGVWPGCVAVAGRQIAVEAGQEVLTHVVSACGSQVRWQIEGPDSLTFIHPDGVAGILTTGNHPVDAFFVDGKCLVVEINSRVGVALAIEDALVTVGVVGEEVLVQALQRPFLDCDGRSAFVERAEGAVEDGLVASEVHGVELEDELALAQWHNGVWLLRIFEVIQQCRERVRILVVLEKVCGLLKDMRGLILCPVDSNCVHDARVGVT